MKCSIIIPTRQRASILTSTLDLLSHQTEKSFEVIVVCDGEDSEMQAFAEQYKAEFPLQFIFLPERVGQASARNVGAKSARSRLLLFLDDDMTQAPEWIELHIQRHEINPCEPGKAVIGKIVHAYSHPPSSRMERIYREYFEGLLEDAEACYARMGPEFIPYACFGVNCSIPRDLFIASGGFDPALRTRGREDYELGARLCNAGVRFEFEPRAIVYHRGTLNLVPDSLVRLKARAPSDLYRVRRKNQRIPQTRFLASLLYGNRFQVSVNRMAWELPEVFDSAAEFSRVLTEATGSQFFFWLWRGFSRGKYWQAVRNEGETISSMRELVGEPLPILMFHSISNPPHRRARALCVSPSRFLKLMEWMMVIGYHTVLPEYGRVTCHVIRPVMLTFDDGYEDFYTQAFPALQALGCKALCFVVVDRIGKTNEWTRMPAMGQRRLLSSAQIQEMHRHGFQFGSHTATHPFLSRAPDFELRREVRDSKSRLEDLLGAEVSCFAYPYGEVDMRIRSAVGEAGYKLAVSADEGRNLWEDPLWMRRVGMSGADNLLSLSLKLATGHDFRAAAIRWAGRTRFRELL